jgi:hypothetical protein
MMPLAGFSRTTGTAIGPGLALQSDRGLERYTKAIGLPILVFISFAPWAEPGEPDSSSSAVAAIGAALQDAGIHLLSTKECSDFSLKERRAQAGLFPIRIQAAGRPGGRPAPSK